MDCSTPSGGTGTYWTGRPRMSVNRAAISWKLMLSGPVKVDLIFPGEPYTSEPPWTVSAETLDGIDQHLWDWTLWLASKREKGEDALVRRELAKMFEHLLGPLGVDEPPASIEEAVEAYTSARERREREFGTRVTRVREREVLRVVANS